MPDEQRGVRPGMRRFERGTLRGEIDRSAAVGIDDHGRDPLREDRLRLVQRGIAQAIGRVRMHVDEPRGNDAIARIHHTPSRSRRSDDPRRRCDHL